MSNIDLFSFSNSSLSEDMDDGSFDSESFGEFGDFQSAGGVEFPGSAEFGVGRESLSEGVIPNGDGFPTSATSSLDMGGGGGMGGRGSGEDDEALTPTMESWTFGGDSVLGLDEFGADAGWANTAVASSGNGKEKGAGSVSTSEKKA